MIKQQPKHSLNLGKSLALSKRHIDSMLTLGFVIQKFSYSINKKIKKWLLNDNSFLNEFLKDKDLNKINKIFPIFGFQRFLNSLDFLDEIHTAKNNYKNSFIVWILVLLICVFVSVYPFDYQDNIETWWGLFIGIKREESIIQLLHFFVFIGWIFLYFYLFIFLFSPLGSTFLLSHQLWIRFTNCQPHEVAISKVIWILVCSTFLGFFISIWGIITAFLNKVSCVDLLWDAFAMSSYIIFAGGLTVFILTCINLFTSAFPSIVSTMVSSFACILSPWIFGGAYFIISLNNPNLELLKIFPLFLPMLFIQSLENVGVNITVATLIGFTFLSLSVIIPVLNQKFRDTVS